MIKLLDNFLNGTTQYRLMLYFLILLFLVAVVLSVFKLLPFSPFNLLFSGVFLTAVSWLTNKIFAKFFNAQTNFESVYITALILILIMTPARNSGDLIFLGAVAFLSQASKYLLAFRMKHFFNPAAFGVVFAALVLNQGTSWWIGNRWMLVFVILGGFLIVRKLQRFSMVLGLAMIYLAIRPSALIPNIFLESPLLFFTFVMLTEPQTTPPTKKRQLLYGGLTGLLFAYFTPELALIFGNIFSYIVSPKEKVLLKLKEKIQIAPEIYDFIFEPRGKFAFLPGQYMEWTYAHSNPDSRGNRRYFTLASSPTEDNLRLGIKFYPDGSSFKKSLINNNQGGKILVGGLAGDFTLPKEASKKLCFVAGGIGITPFRSMIKYLVDKNEKRDIVLLYSAKLAEEFVYKEIFDEADKKLGIKTFYVAGRIDAAFISGKMPDFKDRVFYISGPHVMVDAFEKTLKDMGVSKIKTDFFPGYV